MLWGSDYLMWTDVWTGSGMTELWRRIAAQIFLVFMYTFTYVYICLRMFTYVNAVNIQKRLR